MCTTACHRAILLTFKIGAVRSQQPGGSMVVTLYVFFRVLCVVCMQEAVGVQSPPLA